jgi:predicted metal-dependent phosphoesterase TrpH
LLIDLHTHSYPASDDSFMTVDELIETAKARGLDGVCLTEHDAFWPLEEVAALSRKHGFLVLPGSEINTDGGHVLVFGLHQYTFGMHRPEFLQKLVQRRGGAVVAAHPYRRRFLAERSQDREAMLERACGDQFFRCCQAIEVINGRGTSLENGFAQDLGARLGLGSTGGSDAHRKEQLGAAATRFQRRIAGLEELITELRAGRFQPVAMKDCSGPAGTCGPGGPR